MTVLTLNTDTYLRFIRYAVYYRMAGGHLPGSKYAPGVHIP